MARKKPRSAAQRAATRKMLEARWGKKRRKNPARKTTRRRSTGTMRSIVSRRTGKPVSRQTWSRSPYRRNPRPRAGMLGNIVNNTVIPALVAGGGAIALDLAWGFLPIPEQVKTGPMRHAAKGLGAIGLGFVAGMVLPKKTAQNLSTGAMTVVVYNAYRDMLARFAPTVALGAYLEEPIPAGNGMGAYLAQEGSGALALEDQSMGGGYDLGGTFDLGMGQETADYSYT